MICASQNELATILAILEKHVPKGKVFAFGSRFTRTNRAYSDLDLAVDTGRPMSIDERGRLCEAFEESNLPYRVDVIDYRSISPEFKKIVDGSCEEIYSANRDGAV